MSRYLDPKADVLFKKVFGEHSHILKSFLNAVLSLPDDCVIVDLSYLSPTEGEIKERFAEKQEMAMKLLAKGMEI